MESFETPSFKICHLVAQSCPTLLRTVARQAPLFMGFSRQDHWGEFPCPPSEDLPKLGVEPSSLASPELAGGFLTTSNTWEAVTLYTDAISKKGHILKYWG